MTRIGCGAKEYLRSRTDEYLFKVYPVDIRIKSVSIYFRYVDDAACGLLPLITASCFEEVRFLGQQYERYMKCGSMFGLVFINDYSHCFAEIGHPAKMLAFEQGL